VTCEPVEHGLIAALLAFFTPGPGASHGTRVAILLTGQALAGVGAAAIFPTSVAMLAAGTHTVRARSHAISVWAAALTGAGFVSLVVGGLLARIGHSEGPYASWRWAFLALAVFATVSMVVTLAAAADSSAKIGRSLDWPGQITVAVGVFALLFGVIHGTSAGYVIGMFAYLGTAYATSIRLAAIQGYLPLMTSIGFVCLNVMGVVLFPVSSRMIERFNPGWVLAAGMACIAAGDLTLSAIRATNLSIAAVAVPLLVVGIGFKLALTLITVVAVNSVPTAKAGMASGATSMLRDFGLTLGPAVVGAIALTQAAHEVAAKVAASPRLGAALAAFNAAPAHAPAAQRPQLEAAVSAVNSGPLGANSVPATITLPNGHVQPFNPLKDVAFHALSSAYSVGYLVCGLAALAAALIAAIALGGRRHHSAFLETD